MEEPYCQNKVSRQIRKNMKVMIVNAVKQMLVLIIDICIVIFVLSQFFIWFNPVGSFVNIVNGHSMDPTLHDRQIMFSDASPIKRGDIVMSKFPESYLEEHSDRTNDYIIKRVVGMPGDKLHIDEDGRLFINDTEYNEYYLTEDAKKNTYVENALTSVKLDDDEYFLMGDNRAGSNDSRFFGKVSAYDLMYKQSVKPTMNFYAKMVTLIILFVIAILLTNQFDKFADYIYQKLINRWFQPIR